MAQATFEADCFWGVEAALRKLPGVVSARVGCSGGSTAEPTYRAVCAGTTGHAEPVELEHDPVRISYETLLESFWAQYNLSIAAGAGSQRKDQYRSAIFFARPSKRRRRSPPGIGWHEAVAIRTHRHGDSERTAVSTLPRSITSTT